MANDCGVGYKKRLGLTGGNLYPSEHAGSSLSIDGQSYLYDKRAAFGVSAWNDSTDSSVQRLRLQCRDFDQDFLFGLDIADVHLGDYHIHAKTTRGFQSQERGARPSKVTLVNHLPANDPVVRSCNHRIFAGNACCCQAGLSLTDPCRSRCYHGLRPFQ